MDEYKILERGIQQLLGREEYDAPVPLIECVHVSDGFIYEEAPTFTTLMCSKCGLHYNIDRVNIR